jgi:hypothetical protein
VAHLRRSVIQYPDILRASGTALLYLREIPMIKEDLCVRFAHADIWIPDRPSACASLIRNDGALLNFVTNGVAAIVQLSLILTIFGSVREIALTNPC